METTAPSALTGCQWICNANVNLTAQDALILAKQLRKELLLDKSKLSINIRKKISVTDDRPSARAIGSIGIIILICVMMVVVLSDSRNIYKKCKTLVAHIRYYKLVIFDNINDNKIDY